MNKSFYIRPEDEGVVREAEVLAGSHESFSRVVVEALREYVVNYPKRLEVNERIRANMNGRAYDECQNT